jgi:hypothetical protein
MKGITRMLAEKFLLSNFPIDIPGVNVEGVTPLPISNREVKPL